MPVCVWNLPPPPFPLIGLRPWLKHFFMAKVGEAGGSKLSSLGVRKFIKNFVCFLQTNTNTHSHTQTRFFFLPKGRKQQEQLPCET